MLTISPHPRFSFFPVSASRPAAIAIVLLATLFLPSPLAARVTTVSDSTEVFFPVSHTRLDPGFEGNGRRINGLVERVDSLRESDPSVTVRQIRVEGAASPEGSVAFNAWLSKMRADAIFKCVGPMIDLPDSLKSDSFIGRDWRGLYAEVMSDEAVPYRDEVIALLVEGGVMTPEGPEDGGDSLLAGLKKLHGGLPYAYMLSNEFPQLRVSRLFVDYTLSIPSNLGAGPSLLPEMPTAFIPFGATVNSVQPRATCPFYMALKTNMLTDLLAIPSLSAEFFVGRSWSVVANWMYGWWDNDRSHHYWRAYGGDIAVRRWFGKRAAEKPLTGHHVGLYAGAMTFDFEFGGNGIMGGRPRGTLWDRCLVYGGIEYGYSLPVGRRINIDFTIGFGYMGGRYLKYRPVSGGYEWLSTHSLNWFGPTKAEVSLVWLIGRDNFNAKK